MPKATEGGASNAWEPLVCAGCGARVAPGAPRCPECPSTEFTAPETVPDDAAEVPAGDDGEAAGDGDDPPVPSPDPPRVPPRRPAPPEG